MWALCSGFRQGVYRRCMGCATALGELVLAAALSGCVSFSYLDGENVRHIIGFTDIADVHDAAQNPTRSSPPLDDKTKAVTRSWSTSAAEVYDRLIYAAVRNSGSRTVMAST